MKFVCTITIQLSLLLTANFSLAQSPEPAATPDTKAEPPPTHQAQIFGIKESLSADQVKRIKEAQKNFFKKHQSVVSYGFYNRISNEISILQDWKKLAEQDKTGNFHLFLKIGIFKNSHTVSAHYRYPPPLQNVDEIDKILQNLVSDLQSEPDLNDVINKSFTSIEDELNYLKNKTKYEAKQQKKVDDFEASQLKAYLLKIAIITLCIIVPILAIFFIWSIVNKISNRRPYLFPDFQYTPRLGAKYSAKSTSQIRK